MLKFELWLVESEMNTPGKILYVCRGISGSGKSTLAKQLGKDGVVFSTDDFFMTPEGEYNFKPEDLHKNHQLNQKRTKEAMEEGISPIVVDNTNTTAAEIAPYVLLANKFGYKVEIREPNTPWKFDAEELAKRNTHGVSLGTIKDMLKKWQTGLTPENILKFNEPSTLRNILQPVPQSPTHHSEGNAFIHTRLVRKQLDDAVAYYQKVVADKNSVFSNLDPQVSNEDINLLRIAAWMHDIGKASATVVDDKHWTTNSKGQRVQALGHEMPFHFEPMMQRLGQPWKRMYENASEQDKKDLWYVIRHHMDLKHEGFVRKSLEKMLDSDGKFINERRIKLLLILMMMDKSGRIGLGELNGAASLPGLTQHIQQSALNFQAKRTPPRPQTWQDPASFISNLKNKGLDNNGVRKAFMGKFGREPTPEELQESFSFRRFFVETQTTADEKQKLAEIIQHLIAGDKKWLDSKAIQVGNKGDYWILNYLMGKENNNEYNQLTRGIVVRKPKPGEQLQNPLSLITSFPFTRFYNQGEEKAAPVDMSKAEMLEKLDGSMVGVFFPTGDPNAPQFHTRKMLSTHKDDMERMVPTFGGKEFKFMGVIDSLVKGLRFSQQDIEFTYVFEFIHEASQVLTKYKPEQYGLYLIGARHLPTHQEVSEQDLDAIAPRIGAKRPRRWSVKASHEEIIAMLKQLAQSTPDFEGLVFRDDKGRIKVKDPDYVEKHHHIGNQSYGNLLEKIAQGEEEEVLAYRPDAAARIDEIKAAYNKYLDDAVAKIRTWQTKGLRGEQLAHALFGMNPLPKWQLRLMKIRGEAMPKHTPAEPDDFVRGLIMKLIDLPEQELRNRLDAELKRIILGEGTNAGSPNKVIKMIGLRDNEEDDAPDIGEI